MRCSEEAKTVVRLHSYPQTIYSSPDSYREDRAPDYESEGLRFSRQGGIINRQTYREVFQLAECVFWVHVVVGSSPAFPTKNGEISVKANTAVCESVNTGFESRISPKGNTLTLES